MSLASQVAYAASAALYITNKVIVQAEAAAQARAHRLCPAAIQQHIALICRFNGLHPHDRCTYMEQYSFTDHGSWGMEGWVRIWFILHQLLQVRIRKHFWVV